MKQLAIIIPAYKEKFLGMALESIALQSCQDFTVYIGDDNSPQNVFSVVERFKNKVDLVYHRFDSNMGGHDLVGQWERCIALSQGEPWIWLFSDDDEIEPDCVEKFYEEIKKGCKYDLYHFDVDIIDENSDLFSQRHPFPMCFSSKEFIVKKFKGEIASYVVEYIFSRECYDNLDGFQNYDLAWGSDDATWIKFGLAHGIKTIKGPKVRWRLSNLNISPNNNDRGLVLRKVEADLVHISYMNKIWPHNNLQNLQLLYVEASWFCSMMNAYKTVLSHKEVRKYLSRYSKIVGVPFLMWPLVMLVKIMKLRHG